MYQTFRRLLRVAPQIIVLVVVRVCWAFILRQRMLFQLLHHDFDGLVELGVVSLAVRRWIEIDLIVWRNASPLRP
jgi:hypothetical protein